MEYILGLDVISYSENFYIIRIQDTDRHIQPFVSKSDIPKKTFFSLEIKLLKKQKLIMKIHTILQFVIDFWLILKTYIFQ